jgi:hypothetical protein
MKVLAVLALLVAAAAAFPRPYNTPKKVYKSLGVGRVLASRPEFEIFRTIMDHAGVKPISLAPKRANNVVYGNDADEGITLFVPSQEVLKEQMRSTPVLKRLDAELLLQAHMFDDAVVEPWSLDGYSGKSKLAVAVGSRKNDINTFINIYGNAFVSAADESRVRISQIYQCTNGFIYVVDGILPQFEYKGKYNVAATSLVNAMIFDNYFTPLYRSLTKRFFQAFNENFVALSSLVESPNYFIVFAPIDRALFRRQRDIKRLFDFDGEENLNLIREHVCLLKKPVLRSDIFAAVSEGKSWSCTNVAGHEITAIIAKPRNRVDRFDDGLRLVHGDQQIRVYNDRAYAETRTSTGVALPIADVFIPESDDRNAFVAGSFTVTFPYQCDVGEFDIAAMVAETLEEVTGGVVAATDMETRQATCTSNVWTVTTAVGPYAAKSDEVTFWGRLSAFVTQQGGITFEGADGETIQATSTGFNEEADTTVAPATTAV